MPDLVFQLLFWLLNTLVSFLNTLASFLLLIHFVISELINLYPLHLEIPLNIFGVQIEPPPLVILLPELYDEDEVFVPQLEILQHQHEDEVVQPGILNPEAPHVLTNLPRRIVNADEEEVLCCICISEAQVGENITTLPCNHHYHTNCILEWLAINEICPICKQPL